MSELLSCLSRNMDIFAWNVEDMPGIDLEVVVYRLNINPEARPFVQEVQYPKWLANVVLVKKANGKWRVCINFTDPNKACPKDSYPLSRIDNMVDSTSGHMLYSFLDVFLGYHQFLMVEEDQEKTSFMVDSAIYCYRVIPFGLKNVGATYQRLVNKIFAKLIGKTVEAYVDDMVVKSKHLNSHVSDLEEVFAMLRRYNMKLNPAKCALGVASGKFLGFMITHRGIEANPNKIQALINMEVPKCKRDIQKLTGHVAALNMFVSRAADRYFPFFKLLRENKETRYTLAEQLVLALLIVAKKLRSYFQSRPIVVLTNKPFKHILQKPDVLGRLLKWAIELDEFDIEFMPRPAIKAQALADFIAELTPRSLETPAKGSNSTLEIWEIFVDGASNSSGSGADIIITSPEKTTEIQCALRFEFEATNNEVQYEAIVIALELTKNLECECVKVFSDSQLVVARAENAKADALSRLVFMGVDGLDRTVHIKMVREPSIAQKPSVIDILHTIGLPEAFGIELSFTLPYLRCLKPSESLQAMTEVHEGICGNHQEARALAYKLIRFGIPKVLITDNGRQFNNPQFKNFCASKGIDHRLTLVSHPQSIGLAEVTNRIILQDLRTRIGDAKGDWPDATIPIEVSLPTIRKLETTREMQTTEHLNLLEKIREQASLRAVSYQNRTAKHFNNKVQTKRFRAGDLVLRKAEAVGHQPGKLGPTWEGPYEVIRKLKGGAYSLRDTSGRPLPRP
ncbi:uncharacterized protein LOC111376801 [Olea europaea var. sylvestris]|uniref:uncharacterized protein LOC111376801 n=1 Tax=Olea europaea var. sylvestris TaxID=158386 RepID=UPI000C1D6058|nr:uncharacterized protein LOC111376801 [Olea europaea var. sylvestris]